MKAKAALKIFVYIAVLLIAAVLAAGIFAPSCGTAYAADAVEVVKATVSNLQGNAYAVKSTLKVYTQDGDDAVFCVPESYYVKIMRAIPGGAVYEIEYCGQTFYISADQVKNNTQTVAIADGESLYPNVALTLADSTTINGATITNDSHTIRFLGYSEDGNSYYCLFAAKTGAAQPQYGFVAANNVQSFTVPYQTRTQQERENWLAQQKAPTPQSGDILPSGSVALRVALIIGIAVPGALIVLLLFRPTKADKAIKHSVRETDNSDYDRSRSIDSPTQNPDNTKN